MIKVNDNAKEKITALLAESGKPEGSFVRVGGRWMLRPNVQSRF